MSIPNDLSTYEKMANMKNLLGGSFVEILKQNIKSQQNENVKKMLDIAKEKPDAYIELLSVAIFHHNKEIIEYMIDKFKLTEADIPYINSLSFYNSILKDNSPDKLNDAKENYIEIDCPIVLLSGIGGNIDIFKLLLEKKLISDINPIGVIGLSKKYKNAFNSNIVGACAYYGNYEMLEFILKTYEKLDLNVQSNEKKSKQNARLKFNKEYSGYTPMMLSIVGPGSDSQTIEVLKILNNYHINFNVIDFNKDNVLHLATKNKKVETAKFLVENLNLSDLISKTNKDGYTPFSLAQHLNEDNIISYFSDKAGIDEKEIEKNIEELINESESIQNRKNAKKKKNKKSKYIDFSTISNTSENKDNKEEDKEEEPKKSSNDNKSNTQNKKSSTTYHRSSNNSNNTSSNNREKLRALFDNVKVKKKKEKPEVEPKKGDVVKLSGFDSENSYVIGFDLLMRFRNIEVLPSPNKVVQRP